MISSTEYKDQLLKFLSHSDLFVVEETKARMNNKFDIAPNEFLDFAEKDIASNLQHKFVNALANIKRALDSQVSNIFSAFGISDKKMGLERKMEILQKAGSVTPRILNKVNQIRNLMEHEYANPDGETVIDMLDVVSLFIAYTDTIMSNYPEEVVVAWQNEDKDAVFVAPAHTFLMMNRPVTIQFWLDAGSSGWYERLSQPLTHPYVLSREWQTGRQWTDADDVQYGKEAMARLVSGLLRKCRERVYLGIVELGESGFEGRGELLRAFQKVLM